MYRLILVCAYWLACSGEIIRVTLPEADRQYMMETLIQEKPDLGEVDARKLIYELENYYTSRKYNWTMCGPPRKIDAIYHLHVLNTRLYRSFCDVTFGRFIEHEPFWSGNPTSDDQQTECADQVRVLESKGIKIVKPCLWNSTVPRLLDGRMANVWGSSVRGPIVACGFPPPRRSFS